MDTAQVASRLVEIGLQIRAIFRAPVDGDLSDPEPEDALCIVQPVCGTYAPQTFAEPAATQLRPSVGHVDDQETSKDNSVDQRIPEACNPRICCRSRI